MREDHMMTRQEEQRRDADAELRSELKEARAKERHIPDAAVCFFKDGDEWCCVFGNFIDLQVSPSGFGQTFSEALDDLNKSSLAPGAVKARRLDSPMV